MILRELLNRGSSGTRELSEKGYMSGSSAGISMSGERMDRINSCNLNQEVSDEKLSDEEFFIKFDEKIERELRVQEFVKTIKIRKDI